MGGPENAQAFKDFKAGLPAAARFAMFSGGFRRSGSRNSGEYSARVGKSNAVRVIRRSPGSVGAQEKAESVSCRMISSLPRDKPEYHVLNSANHWQDGLNMAWSAWNATLPPAYIPPTLARQNRLRQDLHP